jgi:hypothetical protein
MPWDVPGQVLLVQGSGIVLLEQRKALDQQHEQQQIVLLSLLCRTCGL